MFLREAGPSNKLLVDRIKIWFKDDAEYRGIDPDESPRSSASARHGLCHDHRGADSRDAPARRFGGRLLPGAVKSEQGILCARALIAIAFLCHSSRLPIARPRTSPDLRRRRQDHSLPPIIAVDRTVDESPRLAIAHGGRPSCPDLRGLASFEYPGASDAILLSADYSMVAF